MVDARIVRTLANHMLSKDEPDHKRLRDIVDEAFRRRAVLEMEPRILPSPMSLPANCSQREVQPIWSNAMRASCRCP